MVYFWPNLQTWISILIEKSHLPHISWHLQRDWTTKKCESVTFLPFLHKPKKIIQNSSKPKSLPSLKITFSHLKINAWKTTVVSLEFASPGRCYVNVREGTMKKKSTKKSIQPSFSGVLGQHPHPFLHIPLHPPTNTPQISSMDSIAMQLWQKGTQQAIHRRLRRSGEKDTEGNDKKMSTESQEAA